MDDVRETTTGAATPREVRVVRAVDEFVRLRTDGQPVLITEFVQSYPDIATELREHLALVAHLQPQAAEIRHLVAQGLLAPSPDPAYTGELGAYRISGIVGRGGMGVVLRAYEPSLDRVVALKLLRPELGADAAAVVRFEREAKAAAALQHPSIITIYAVGQAGPTHYLATEFVDGPSLAELIRAPSAVCRVTAGASPTREAETGIRSGLPTPLIRRIFQELLQALDAAHRAGLVHRDVKPSNVLLSAKGLRGSGMAGFRRAPLDGTPSTEPAGPSDPQALSPFVKLADFGLARMRSSLTQVTLPGSILGTPEYMSPEQARGDANVDHRTDLYSAGVVLFEMLTGRTPFHADTPTATIQRILNEEPADPRTLDRHVDPVLANLALRLMAKRAERRFPSAREALGALETGRSIPAYRRLRLRWPLWASAGLAALGLAAWIGAPRLHWADDVAARGLHELVAVEIEHYPDYRLIVGRTRSGARQVLDWAAKAITGQPFAVALADLDGLGERTLLVGTGPPANARNDSLWAVRPNGVCLWKLSLTPEVLRPWPDCHIAEPWLCTVLVAGNLDGQAGDEIVAIAHDWQEIPCRVSVVDPRKPEIRRTFWHLGQIASVQIVPRFFLCDGAEPEGRAALVAWGMNNKLDGFDRLHDRDQPDGYEKRLPGDELPSPAPSWDMVPVLMILDPAPDQFDGLGPPRTRRLDWLPGADHFARPFAYAFFDAPGSPAAGPRIPGTDKRVALPHFDAVAIDEVKTQRAVPAEAEQSMFRVRLRRLVEGASLGATLYLDSSLQVVEDGVIIEPGEPQTESWWRSHWRTIIQDYECVN